MGKRIKQFGKKLFLSAGVMVSAAMLGSCAGDSISVQPAGQDVQGQQGAVGFDAYLSRATSRNGAEGELTPNTTGTGKVSLEGKGFGVFAYYTDNADYDGHSIPNFMWNQKVAKDATAGWTYSPVKYWPNEFSSANAEEADRVSFFAYAPYVEADVASGKTAAATDPDTGEPTEVEGTGITAFSRNNATGDPLVKYVVNLDPKKAVDLCWGTVDQNRDWTKANKIPDPGNPGSETSETQSFVKGMPWLNVERPASVSANDSKVKFQFEHALAQLNIQVKNDVDIASPADAGENVGSQTRVWIRSITLSGFSTMGALNLHNTAAGKAKWLDYYDSRELLPGETLKVHDGRKDGEEGTAAAVNEQVTGINPVLVQTDRYVVTGTDIESAELTCATATSTGVTNVFQNVFSGAATGDGAAAADAPIYVIPTGEAVKVTIAYDVETYSPNLATYLSDGKTRGASISNVITKDITLSGGAPMTMANGKKYTVKLHLGLNSVKFDAAVSDWADGNEAEPGLPGNREVFIQLNGTTINKTLASAEGVTLTADLQPASDFTNTEIQWSLAGENAGKATLSAATGSSTKVTPVNGFVGPVALNAYNPGTGITASVTVYCTHASSAVTVADNGLVVGTDGNLYQNISDVANYAEIADTKGIAMVADGANKLAIALTDYRTDITWVDVQNLTQEQINSKYGTTGLSWSIPTATQMQQMFMAVGQNGWTAITNTVTEGNYTDQTFDSEFTGKFFPFKNEGTDESMMIEKSSVFLNKGGIFNYDTDTNGMSWPDNAIVEDVEHNTLVSYGLFRKALVDCGGTNVVTLSYWLKGEEFNGEKAWDYSFLSSCFWPYSKLRKRSVRPVLCL